MKKISFFFNSFAKTLTTPAYYADILRAKLSFSLMYFFMLTIILTMVTAIKIAVPVAIFDLPTAVNKVVAQYPSDLVVHLKQGNLTINQPAPYAMPIPREWQEKDTPSNLFVYDYDKNIHSPQDFYNYDSAVLLTESSIYTTQDNGRPGIRVYSLPKDKDVTLSNTILDEGARKFLNRPLVKTKLYVPILGLIMFLMLLPILFIFRVVTAFCFAIVTYFVVRVFKVQMVHDHSFSLKKIFQVSLHTMTLPIVLAYLTSLVIPMSPIHGLTYFGIYFIFTIYVLIQVTSVSYSKKKPLITS